MGIGSRALTAGGLASAAAFVVGCGTQSPITGALSQNANRTIVSDLSAVSDAVSNGSCAKAKSALSMLDATLSDLPSSTNRQLVSNLTQGSTTLRTLALRECSGTTTTTRTTTSPSTSTTTSSTSSTTPTTTSSPTTTTPTTTNTQSGSGTIPGTGSVTQLGSGSGTSTNGGGGLAGGG
jgi:hypothetical protein